MVNLKEFLEKIGEEYVHFCFGDEENLIVSKLGESYGIYEQKKHKVKIVKYEKFEFTFIKNKLNSYKYIFPNLNNKIYLTEIINANNKILSGDFIVVSFENVNFVFHQEDESLFQIQIKLEPMF